MYRLDLMNISKSEGLHAIVELQVVLTKVLSIGGFCSVKDWR